MDKDIKKSIDSIQVPKQKLNSAIENGLNASKKQIIPRGKKIMSLVLSSVAIFGIVIGSGFVSPTMASMLSKVPLLDSIFTTVGDKGLQVAINDENAISLNETITSNGVSLKVEEVVFDGTRLAYSFEQSEGKIISPDRIEVNGEEINFSASVRGSHLPNGQFSGIVQINPAKSLPTEFDLVVSTLRIGETKGDWQFKTHVVQTDNNSVDLGKGQRAELDGFTYEVKEFESTNSAVSLKVLFKGTNKAYLDAGSTLHLHLLDQKGNPIQMISHTGSGDEKGMLQKFVFEPISEDVTSLTISPFFRKRTSEWKEITEVLDKNRLPLILSQGDMGDIVVTRIKEENDHSVIYFESTSSFPFGPKFEFNQLIVTDSEDNVLITDWGYPKAIGKNKYKMYINDSKVKGDIIMITTTVPNMTLNPKAQITVKIPK